MKTKITALAITVSGLLGGVFLADMLIPKFDLDSASEMMPKPSRENLEPGSQKFASSLKLENNTSFTLNIRSENKKPIANRFTIEMMDDRGALVDPLFVSSDQNLEKGGHREHTLIFDKVLPDGYYFARATSVFADDISQVGLDQAELYFSSKNGELSKVSDKEWNDNSLVNVAMTNIEKEKSHE